jgi:hypothetical protein
VSSIKRFVPAPVRSRVRRAKEERKQRAFREACPLPGGIVTRLDDGELPHYCLPLEDPTWVTADTARYVVPDDAVLGFEVDGQPYAVAWDVMAAHHVANLELGGRSWALTLCDMCVGGGLYEATRDGTTFRFRVDGLYGGTPYVIDQQTGSLWTMVTMRPIKGPAVASGELVRRPVVHATWSEWVAMHPDTLIVDDPGEPEDGHGGDARFPGHSHFPVFAAERLAPDDDRLPGLDLVLGIEVGDAKRAYPLEDLHAANGIVNDELGGRPVVVVTVPGTYLALAFDREVHGRALSFGWAEDKDEHGAPLLTDLETSSRWDLFGKAVAGELAGSQLAYVWGGLEKWFNWSNLAAGTSIWSGDRPT